MKRSVKNQLLTTLDVGSSKICAITATLNDELEPKIQGTAVVQSRGVKRGIVVDITALGEAIHSALHMVGAEGANVYVGVTGSHTASHNCIGRVAISNPNREITRSDVDLVIASSREIVIPPDRRVLHTIARSYVVEGHEGVHNPVGMSASRLEVNSHVVHGVATILENMEKAVSASGAHPVGLVLQSMAAGEAVLLPAEKEIGVCLVDIGAGTTDIAVFTQSEIFHSAVLPTGGDDITTEISHALTITQEEAEQIKIHCGTLTHDLLPDGSTFMVKRIGREQSVEFSAKLLTPILERAILRIMTQVLCELEAADCMDKIPAGIVLTGGTSQLPGFQPLAARQTNLPVRNGTSWRPGSHEQLAEPTYAVAAGMMHFVARQRRLAIRAVAAQGMTGIEKFFRRVLGASTLSDASQK